LSNWSKEDIAKLTDLVRKGYSAGQIAEAFAPDSPLKPRSRNAVIGKCSRLGLQLEGGSPKSGNSKAAKPKKDHLWRQRRSAKANTPTAVAAPAIATKPGDPSLHILWGELKETGACKWPTNEDRDVWARTFCGLATEQREPFCTHHIRMGYQSRSQPERRNASR
jgi:hypothetical protein